MATGLPKGAAKKQSKRAAKVKKMTRKQATRVRKGAKGK